MEKLIKLAKKLDTQFKEDNFDVYNFHNLASKILEEVNDDDVTIDKIISHLDKGLQSEQFILDDQFGEPSITLYHSDEIILDILLWTSSDTNIHTHGFTGAFRTMVGETIQAIYDTKNKYEPPYAEFIEDEVSLKELKNLKAGSIQEIPSGMSFMHKSYHIDIPTINLLFRTIGNRERDLGLIQHSVKPHGILYRSYAVYPKLSKRFSLINALIKVKDERAPDLLRNFVKGLGDADLIGLKRFGIGNIHYSEMSKTIMFTEIVNEIKRRGLDNKLENIKSSGLLVKKPTSMKSFDKLSCAVESLIDCRVSLDEMDSFLKKIKICEDTNVLIDTVVAVIRTYNEAKLIRLTLNEVALDIVRYMLMKKSNDEISKALAKEYDAPIETIAKDVENTSKDLLENTTISFLF